MNILKNKMQRRDFLRTIAKAGLTTAFTSQFMMSPDVFAAAGGAKRFIMVYYPNGCVRSKWHSYNTGALGSTSFANSPLDPLTPYVNKIVTFKSLTFKGNGGSDSHPESCRGVFSGGVLDATTFDVAIGEALGGRLTKNMHVGVWSSRATSTAYMPFTNKSGAKIAVPDNPQLVYDNLLADVVNGSGGTTDPDAARRQRVLESLQDDLNLLQAYPLEVKQQGKLLSHEEALTFYSSTLNSTLNIGTGYSRPTVGMTGINSEAEDVAKAQMRNIAMAFQANVTRTATFQFMASQDESLMINFPSIQPYMGSYGTAPMLTYNQTKSHVSSHDESDLFSSQQRWYNMMVKYLMDELAARADATYGGTLLDNTLILVMSEDGGGAHEQNQPGIYVAGGAGGAYTMGKSIVNGGGTDTDSDASTGMSNLYLDISKAFGLSWGSYGNSTGSVSGFL